MFGVGCLSAPQQLTPSRPRSSARMKMMLGFDGAAACEAPDDTVRMAKKRAAMNFMRWIVRESYSADFFFPLPLPFVFGESDAAAVGLFLVGMGALISARQASILA